MIELPEGMTPIRVFCREYDGPGADHRSHLAFESVNRLVKRFDHLGEASVWRMQLDDEPGRFYVYVADQNPEGQQDTVDGLADWYGGVPGFVDDEDVEMFTMRRLRVIAALGDEAAIQSGAVTRWKGGAVLNPDGTASLRGQGQG